MSKICKHCGYERQEIESVSEYECPRCGAIYIKVEAQLKRKAEELLRQKEEIKKECQPVIARYNEQMENIQLDCNACKSKNSMKATKIPKFNTILRIIGFIIVIPSVLGVFLAILMFISTTTGILGSMSATQSNTGAAIFSTIGFSVSFFFGCSSLVGGIIGWVLLMKKKVYKCFNCGFILDRA